jgi:hypothetical protein
MLNFIDSIANVLVFLAIGLGLAFAGAMKAFFSERREKKVVERELEDEKRRGNLTNKVQTALELARREGIAGEEEAVRNARDGRRDHFESEK